MPEMFIDVEAAPRGEGGAPLPTVQNWANTEKPTTAVPVTAGKAIMDVIIDGRRYIPADGLDSAAYLQKVEKKKKMRKARRCGIAFLLLILIALAFASFGHRMGHKGRHGHKGKGEKGDDEDNHHGHKTGGKKHGGRGGKHGRHGLGWRGMKDEPEVDPTDLRYALEDQVHDQELQAIQEEAGQAEVEVEADPSDVPEDTPQSGKATIQGRGGKKGGKKGGRRGERKTVDEICAEMTEAGEPEKKDENEAEAVTEARLKVWNLKKQIACDAAASEDKQKDETLLQELKEAYKAFKEAKKAAREASSASSN